MEKHGLVLKNLGGAARETRVTGHRLYTLISYDLKTGDIYADTYPDCNSYPVYRAESVIQVYRTDRPMSQQQIADKIAEAVREYRWRMQGLHTSV